MYIVNHPFHQMVNLIVIPNIKYTPSEIAIYGLQTLEARGFVISYDNPPSMVMQSILE